VVKIIGGVWDEFHREMTLKSGTRRPLRFFIFVMCLHSFFKNYISIQQILLDPQNNAGFTTSFLITLTLSHLLHSLRLQTCRPGSSVGISTDNGLVSPGSNSGGDETFRPSRSTLGPNQPPVK